MNTALERLCLACAGTLALVARGQLAFDDSTEEVGLGGLQAAHVLFADVNGDGRPDAVIDRTRVFLHTADESAPLGFRYVEAPGPGLPTAQRGDLCVFADIDSDGAADAVFTRYLDVNAEGYQPPTEGPLGTCWLRGNGDGTFGAPVGAWMDLAEAPPATTAAIAVGDVNRDGRLDIYLGNWYAQYGASLEGITNTLLEQRSSVLGVKFERADPGFDRQLAGEESPADDDLGDDEYARPTYGVMIVALRSGVDPQLLDLNYGRRWNRLWESSSLQADQPEGRREELALLTWFDMGPIYGLDGDEIRHGRYPAWLKERAKTDPRFDRPDEKPFRANGNTFDAAVGDIDNDGDFDLFLAEITHGWAGESSDRSRFLVQEVGADGFAKFTSPARLSVDRVPVDPTVRSWNQGDLYAELADFDLDGRLDLLLASSDYPDNQRLRIWRQQEDGTFVDITSWVGIDHIGAQHPSIGDIDQDGDLDVLVGQSFNRLGADQRAGREPRVRVFRNLAADRKLGSSLMLKLVGDPEAGVSRDALGAIVRVTATIDGKQVTQMRQLIGIGGHQGKQHEFIVHFGLGDAERAEVVEVTWPDARGSVTRLEDVAAGRHVIER